VLPDHLSAAVVLGSWPVPALFRMIQERGQLPDEEMLRVFNMGIGMAVIVGKSEVEQFQRDLGEESWVFGELTPGEKKVVLR
jgi:phosphoribosylformylglycinamidine cyclo-ligase